DLPARDNRRGAHAVVLILDVTALDEDDGEDLLERKEEEDSTESIEPEGTKAGRPAEERPCDAGPQDDSKRDQHAGDAHDGAVAHELQHVGDEATRAALEGGSHGDRDREIQSTMAEAQREVRRVLCTH